MLYTVNHMNVQWKSFSEIAMLLKRKAIPRVQANAVQQLCPAPFYKAVDWGEKHPE